MSITGTIFPMSSIIEYILAGKTSISKNIAQSGPIYTRNRKCSFICCMYEICSVKGYIKKAMIERER
jgi:hypothetical protein